MRLPNNILNGLYKFEIEPAETIKHGYQIAFAGFPFEIERVTSQIGYVSSVYICNSIKIFQIDGSINSGNSGGPLINIKTGKVFGIITRSHKGLQENFKLLKEALISNSIALEKVKGMMHFDQIDPIQAIQVSFENMLTIAANLERSANVGIGYGFSINHVWNDIKSLQ